MPADHLVGLLDIIGAKRFEEAPIRVAASPHDVSMQWISVAKRHLRIRRSAALTCFVISLVGSNPEMLRITMDSYEKNRFISIASYNF